MNAIDRDIREIVMKSNVDFKELCGKSVLVTGATGLIGSNLVRALLAASPEGNANISIIAFVRSMEKANKVFGTDVNGLTVIVGDVSDKLEINRPVDYIIHAASQTSSKAFVEDPVGVIDTALQGTENLLKLAKEKRVKAFVYTSSMEVYGAPTDDHKITETHGTNLDTMMVRSSYPESKRMCEALCSAYAAQYGIPVKIIRLTQTFGPGVDYHDGRVFAEFARCAIEQRDIILHTSGATKRSYLYTADAVTAILTVLFDGKAGEAYNAANEDTYCSVYEMAQLVAEKCANHKIQVTREIVEDVNRFGYAPTLHMNLDCSKLRSLGWMPVVSLEDCYSRMISDMIAGRTSSH